ncbi:MAG: hypothetical protein KatS3mg047_0036 [Bellilinea sp.]|nr:MAG: hypothetical protein KatS3mg047_0036 [Bellilinea sp.]
MALSKDGLFYLGKQFDPVEKKLLEQPVLYNPADLTTHAVVTGMTGSGKTGLCIGLLEEAALEGIPAIIIDPKGDLTNLLLHFPDLLSADFEPWIDPENARREGKTIQQLAEETAERWKNGLAEWGLGTEQIRELKDAVDFGLYSPGSSAATPVNILSSFESPDLPWNENREILREKISTIVTALLGLIGFNDIDPLRSREHILLSNILEHAWSSGKSLDLTDLIIQTQKPPFDRLGAFPVDSFFPEKDRLSLAMLLNNFLASPTFEIWREGEPLNIERLLYSPAGKARHSIFYLAHLSESERMFFVTLLFASIESWMRNQRGTGNLRAIIYMDEIYGYLPPLGNPPSKTIMLRMLKQARAFGVGLLLATQNPVDVDYKGLSNAGTWMIGRLQTDQDKQRLLDGLDSAGGGVNRQEIDRLISSLGKRVFVLHSVHAKKPLLFQTRWVLNFLAGPLTRAQLPALIPLTSTVPAQVSATSQTSVETTPQRQSGSTTSTSPYTAVRPPLPGGVEEYFLPNDLPLSEAIQQTGIPATAKVEQKGFVYHPALFAQATINYLARKYNLELNREVAALVQEPRGRTIEWDDCPWRSFKRSEITASPLPSAQYAPLPGWLADARQLNAYQQDFIEWVYRNAAIRLRANEKLKVYAPPEVSTAEFREQCAQAARSALQNEVEKLETLYQKKIEDLNRKIERAKSDVDDKENTYKQRQMEELATHGQSLMNLFGKRRATLSSSMTKRRLTSEAKDRLEKARLALEQLQKQLKEIETEKDRELKQIQDRWADVVNDEVEIPLSPYKKDIFVQQYGIIWMPYYTLLVDGQLREIPAFRRPA